VTKFKILWAPPDEGIGWEPIENIRESPLLIKKYQMREEMKFRKRLRQNNVNDASVPFQFPKVKNTLSNKWKHAAESYVPLGTEKVSRIFEEINVDRGIKLWLVQFDGFPDSHFVNRERIVYYFPLNACLFVNECAMYDYAVGAGH
jgi:hypothetical protein